MTRQQKTVSKIIEIKEITKEQREAEVKTARARLEAEQEHLAALEDDYARTSSDLVRRQSGGAMAATQMELFSTYLKHLTRQIEQQKGIVAIRTSELETKTRAMIETYQEQRLFEILQERIHRGLAREANQGEQREADYQYLTRKEP